MSLLSAAERLFSAAVLALVGLGVPVTVLSVAFGIAWAVRPRLASGRA